MAAFIRFTHMVTGKVHELNADAKKIGQLYNYSVDVATDHVLIELVRNGKTVKSHEVGIYILDDEPQRASHLSPGDYL